MSVVSGSITPPSEGSLGRVIGQTLVVLVVATLAYQALHFWTRDPLHYIVDHTERSFGAYWPRRWWLLLHIGGGTLALFMGPFQLWSGLRSRFLHVHRITGLLYVIGVGVGGAAGFYMSFFSEPRDFGVALFMLAFAWWLTVGMAFLAIKRRRIDAHKEWMIRGYVVTFAFVAFRYLVDLPVFAPLGAARASTVGWLCWVVPLLVTEAVLQWRRTVGPMHKSFAASRAA
jgi:hypothetical protein